MLRIQDLGYFNLSRIKAQAARGEYWLSRLQPRTVLFGGDGERLDGVHWLMAFWLPSSKNSLNAFTMAAR